MAAILSNIPTAARPRLISVNQKAETVPNMAMSATPRQPAASCQRVTGRLCRRDGEDRL